MSAPELATSRPAPAARRAGPEDAPRLAELYEAAVAELAPMRGGRVLVGSGGRSRPVVESFRAEVAGSERATVVGALGAEVVGYGSCSCYSLDASALAGTPSARGPERIGCIEELYVLPEARRHGVGRAVVGVLLEWCSAMGCAGVDATALPGSRSVKSFFESGGFTARALIMHRAL